MCSPMRSCCEIVLVEKNVSLLPLTVKFTVNMNTAVNACRVKLECSVEDGQKKCPWSEQWWKKYLGLLPKSK